MSIKNLITSWKRKHCRHSWRLVSKSPIYEAYRDDTFGTIPKGFIYKYVCDKCKTKKYIES